MSAKIVQICALLILTPAALGRPQFLTFKEGKVGVNFGGYHAQAGLGGLLTGDAAHGGLSASAGTPYGQNAGAGLGGSVDGRTSGGLFAGATAGHGVGATAALAGGVEAEGGVAGGSLTEAHAGGVSKSVVKVVEPQPPLVTTTVVEVPQQPSLTVTKNIVASVGADSVPQNAGETVVYQKVKTKKKFHTAPAVIYQPVVQQDVAVAPQQTISTVHAQSPQAAAGFDYSKYFNFGLGFGGYAQPVVTNHHIHHHRRLKPAKRVQYVVQQPAPVVHVEKRVYAPPPPTVQIHKTIQAAPVVHKHPVVVNPHSSSESSESYSDSIESHEFGHHKHKVVTYTSGVGAHGGVGGGTFFDGIFNIPISTLTAVNQFLNGKAAGHGGVGFQKTVSVTKL
uniref:Putative glycine-rich cell wall structural protein 1 n=1 Tax=Phlebotomus kandelakii TaxID=1109342 RepID=A0A6B2E8T1_9DIPT